MKDQIFSEVKSVVPSGTTVSYHLLHSRTIVTTIYADMVLDTLNKSLDDMKWLKQ
jgi:hypothetical protein